MEYILEVFVRLFQYEIETRCTDVLCKTVFCGLNKQFAWLNLDVSEFV